MSSDRYDKIIESIFFGKWREFGVILSHFPAGAYLISGLADKYCNKVLISSPEHCTEELLQQIFSLFSDKDLPHTWHIPEEASQVIQRFEAYAMPCEMALTYMICDLEKRQKMPQDKEKIEIRGVTMGEEFSLHNDLVDQHFPLVACVRAEYAMRLMKQTDSFFFYTGFRGVEAIATGRLFLGPEFATIYDIGTRVDARGLGAATQMMCHLLDEAKARGYRYVTLSATDAAKSLYGKLGFYAIRKYRVFSKG